ncbi:TSUP family transporter [Tepidibacter hydrothermalis]|uniref:Probable membrane transporter protein n=1 Tax=Tepidibacter hydrothermalis TaxID=3036126 RepID=A0ABY8EF84_9FIRM|nr:TSUP family transporter [Tepidibacter hydrothermalis]WFD11601.1 TSUP family transporter [Tepidibacter hydrothermalis]
MIFKLLFLCFSGFLAAFVDSIAGGGGLISIPAFLIAGIPPHLALGTNKFCSTTASFTSSLSFAKSGKVNFSILKYFIPFTLIGAILGVNTVLMIDQNKLQSLVLVMILFVGLYSLFSKSIGKEDKFTGLNKKNLILGILLCLCLGFYDGFFGPGTGSFLIFGLISVFGFDFTKAAGNARVLNFTSNITALLIFAFNSQINYYYGIPVALCMIMGAKFGTKLALDKGSKLIKPIFVTMSLAVAGKMILDIIN